MPHSRWTLEDHPPSRFASFLPDIDLFDGGIFSVSAAEAACMDPQQRLLLIDTFDVRFLICLFRVSCLNAGSLPLLDF